MKQTILIMLILLMSIFTAQAQSLGSTVLASSGASLTGASGSLSFTMGEAVIGNISNGSSLGQGFWLGATNSIVLSANDFSLDATTTIYPNPTSDYLNVAFDGLENTALDLVLYDIQGRVVHFSESHGINTETISVHQLSAGTYLLNILQKETQQIKTFKIIKQ